ncbi:hypothetical protein ACJIZ3_012363 [Penstemon smallii]|uniref:Glutamate receptor n=1 Tax=Penstemon smallii TaxID=265156 RepID=A0ABD3UND4_9LAMI
MGTWAGKMVRSCIEMALSDYYYISPRNKTRIALHVRDSKGDSFNSIAAALDLLENVEVQAIIIPEISNKELYLAMLGDIARVPVLSFSSISSSSEHPYFIQVAEDETTQFHGIAALLDAFKWRSFVFLYEDTTNARQIQPYILDILHKNHLGVSYQTAISLTSTDDQIINVLHKLMTMKASIILVHLSPSLASQVFRNAKSLGMMNKGFAWIATSKTMDFLDSQDPSVYESMQGVLGFKSYIPSSRKLQSLTFRYRRNFLKTKPSVEIKELNVLGIWAYDASWILADAIERVGTKLPQNQIEDAKLKKLDLARLRVSNSGPSILSEITSSNFTGLGGKIQLNSRKLVRGTYEILNVIGNGERRAGYWTSAYGLTNGISNSSPNILEAIIWPGFTLMAPESRLIQMSGKILKVGIPEKSRFPELVSFHYDQQSNSSTADGFCIDVFQAAIRSLSYNVPFEYVPFDNEYGSYNDLVNEVYLQRYDAAVGDITILSNRSQYVAFTSPYTDLGLGMVAKLEHNYPWFFLKPLNANLWIMSACSFILMGFLVWIFEHPTNEEFQGPPARQICTVLWFTISTLVYAHREKLQSNLSKFVVGIWLFVVFILASSYTANLSSLLTVQQIKLTRSDYIGYSANSFVRGLIRNNLNFHDNRLKPYQSPDEYDKALRSGSKHGGVAAIIEEIPYLKVLLARYPHNYTMFDSSMTTSGFGFAFQKGSPLVHDMSRAIVELREKGRLQELENKWFTNRSPLLSPDSEGTEPSQFNTLSLDSFLGLFLLSGISKAIAIIIFFFYYIRKKLSMSYFISKMLDREYLIFILRNYFPRRVIR